MNKMGEIERTKQFNISALKFSDEVHQYIAELSRTRRLSDWVAKHALEELRRKGMLVEEAPSSGSEDTVIIQQLQEIKQLLLQGVCQMRVAEEVVTSPVIQKLSSDELIHTIDEEELNYNF